jgi:hypothetical protein
VVRGEPRPLGIGDREARLAIFMRRAARHPSAAGFAPAEGRGDGLSVHDAPRRRSALRAGWHRLRRRALRQMAAGAAALPALSSIARAQAYPLRPITMIVAFAAGGTADVTGRVPNESFLPTSLCSGFH